MTFFFEVKINWTATWIGFFSSFFVNEKETHEKMTLLVVLFLYILSQVGALETDPYMLLSDVGVDYRELSAGNQTTTINPTDESFFVVSLDTTTHTFKTTEWLFIKDIYVCTSKDGSDVYYDGNLHFGCLDLKYYNTDSNVDVFYRLYEKYLIKKTGSELRLSLAQAPRLSINSSDPDMRLSGFTMSLDEMRRHGSTWFVHVTATIGLNGSPNPDDIHRTILLKLEWKGNEPVPIEVERAHATASSTSTRTLSITTLVLVAVAVLLSTVILLVKFISMFTDVASNPTERESLLSEYGESVSGNKTKRSKSKMGHGKW